MPLIKKNFTLPYVLILLFSTSSIGQIYNTEIEAKIYLEQNNDFIQVKATAYNKTSISRSLRYVMSLIKKDPETGNTQKTDQADRFVLEPGMKQTLSENTLNTYDESRLILLLLIYDVNDQILGMDRIVLNDDPANNDPDAVKIRSVIDDVDTDTPDLTSADVNTNAEDGLVLRGIVLEETKTKPGRDFFRLFYNSYQANNINSKEIVTLREVFALGRNTKIEVIVGGIKVYEFFLRPKEDYLKEMTRASMYFVGTHLKRQQRDSQIVKRY